MTVEAAQGRELTKDMRRSSGSFELVLSPLLFALVGFGLDRLLGTVPLFTTLFAVMGFGGACVRLYFGYQLEMDEQEKGKPWAKQ